MSGPAAKSMDFKGSLKRLLGLMRPDRALLYVVLAGAARSASALSVSARASSATPPT